MPDHCTYDYAIIRAVPRVERGEFINVGVIVSCSTRAFLEARVMLDDERLRLLDPTLDVATIRRHLDIIPAICQGGAQAGPIGRLAPRQRFDWLTAPRSTVIQTSPVHTGRCTDPAGTLDALIAAFVAPPRDQVDSR